MKPKTKVFLRTTLIITAFYSFVLPPVYFIPVYGWGLEEVLVFWSTGIPLNFVLAFPLSAILKFMTPKLEKKFKT